MRDLEIDKLKRGIVTAIMLPVLVALGTVLVVLVARAL